VGARNAVRVRRRGARTAVLRLLAVLAAAACLGAAGYAGVRASQDPRLALGSVAVNGCSRSAPADVLAAAAFQTGTNVWLLDVGAAVQRIDALPWTKSASIRRRWPNRVSVSVVERRPEARLDLPAVGGGEEPSPQRALIDDDLHVLAVGPDDPRDRALPEIKTITFDPDAARPGADLSATDAAVALAAIRILESAGLPVLSVDIGAATGIGVETADHLRVLFGKPDGLAEKVALYRSIVAKIARPRDVVYVDLRSARAPTVLFK
jgi:hypothetical protein